MNKLTTVLGILIFGITLFNIYKLHEVNSKLEDFYFVDKYEEPEPEIIFLDSIEYDTIFVESKEFIKLPIVDTLILTDTVVAVTVDSVLVEIPIEYKHYSDTLAETAIFFDLRGFQCEVNNLYVKNFLSVPTQENKVKRWYNNFGVGVGLGITYIDRFRICPNIGLYYKLM